jgi:hypothetical protein
MWNWFSCYLSGRHDYGMWCEPGAIFLRCVHCGRRSGGWALGAKPQSVVTVSKPTQPTLHNAHAPAFDRQAAAR